MTVGDQLTTDVRFAQCELKQTGDPINAAAPGARHTVKCVRHAAHTAIECRPRVFIPRVAVSAADADTLSAEDFDRFKCSWQVGRDRHTPPGGWVVEQLPHSSR